MEDYETASLRLFPSCGHIFITENSLQTVDSKVRGLELTLSVESDVCLRCHKCQGPDLNPLESLLKKAKEIWTDVSEGSERVDDEDELNANRWALDFVYIKSILQGYQQQMDPVLDIIYQNHLHNGERWRDSLLKSLQEDKWEAAQDGTAENPERWISREHGIHLEFTRLQGKCFGRAWADRIRSKPETMKIASVYQAPGDISITLKKPLQNCSLWTIDDVTLSPARE
jgi:hypothetical protein